MCYFYKKYKFFVNMEILNFIIQNSIMVELRRVELLTSCLQGRRSSQLSYSPIL